ACAGRSRIGDGRPVRRDEGAARGLLPHRGERPQRCDPHRVAHPAGARRQHRSQTNTGVDAMSYVDGFVIAVSNDKVAKYKKVATVAKRVWIEHGALQYVEAVGDDL